MESLTHKGRICVRRRSRPHPEGISDHCAIRAVVRTRFYRSTAARTMTGLGLAIVKQVADNHPGTITAEPAPGRARFVLTLRRGTPTDSSS